MPIHFIIGLFLVLAPFALYLGYLAWRYDHTVQMLRNGLDETRRDLDRVEAEVHAAQATLAPDRRINELLNLLAQVRDKIELAERRLNQAAAYRWPTWRKSTALEMTVLTILNEVVPPLEQAQKLAEEIDRL